MNDQRPHGRVACATIGCRRTPIVQYRQLEFPRRFELLKSEIFSQLVLLEDPRRRVVKATIDYSKIVSEKSRETVIIAFSLRIFRFANYQ